MKRIVGREKYMRTTILCCVLVAAACDNTTTESTSATAGAGATATTPLTYEDKTRANADNNPKANAENTKLNERDRNPAAKTPFDQGNSAAETDLTAAVRKAVVGDEALSTNAKNVKIITNGTKVTLRGPVNSEQEKKTIESLAKRTAGVTEVDNQIEVKEQRAQAPGE